MAEEQENLFNISFDSIQDESLIEIDDSTGEDVVVDKTKTQKTNSKDININNSTENSGEEEEEENDLGNLVDKSKSTSKTSDKKEDAPDPEGDSSLLTPFASLLQEKGFLQNLNIEEFKKAENKYDALTEAFKKEDELRIEAIINKFPEELIELAKAVAQGLPFSEIKEKKIKELSYNAITDEHLKDEDTQIKLVTELLSLKGFKEAKITKMIDTYKDLGNLEEEAKEALPELKDFYKQEQEKVKTQFRLQQEQLEKSNKEAFEKVQNTVKSTEEIIPGIKLNEVNKTNLFKNMTQIVGQDNNGNPMNYVMQMRSKDPVKFDMAVTYLADLTKGFTDWSKISKTAKTNAVKEFEKTLQSTSYTYGKPNINSNKQEEGTEKLVRSLEEMFGK